VGEIVPLLVVDDVRATIDYYQRTLSFDLDFSFPADSPTFATVRRQDVRIMFEAATSYAAKIEPGSASGTRGQGVDLHIMVAEGIDGYYESVTRAGVTAVRPIFTTSYGMRQFTIRDLSGYVLTFIQNEAGSPSTGE